MRGGVNAGKQFRFCDFNATRKVDSRLRGMHTVSADSKTHNSQMACMCLQLFEHVRLTTAETAMREQTQWHVENALGLLPSAHAALRSTLDSVQLSGATQSARFGNVQLQHSTGVEASCSSHQRVGITAATSATVQKEHNVASLKLMVKAACQLKLKQRKGMSEQDEQLQPAVPRRTGTGRYNPMVPEDVQGNPTASFTRWASRTDSLTVFEQPAEGWNMRTRQQLAEQVADAHQLNTGQRRAFFCFTDHVSATIAFEDHETQVCPEQFTAYIGGPGGTGKSWILQAWKTYLRVLGKTAVRACTGIRGIHEKSTLIRVAVRSPIVHET